MKKVVITGASGMVGGLLLEHCLGSDEVGEVVSLVRNTTGKTHPKLKERVLTNFLEYDAVEQDLRQVDVVFYCLGVYTGAVPPERFRQITVDYPFALAQALYRYSPQLRFCLLSGQGADRTEKSKLMFARDKGTIENLLANMGFDAFISFRPGYIYPVVARKEPNLMYRFTRKLYPVLKLMGDGFSITSTQLAAVMFRIGMRGCSQEVLENKEMIQLLKN
jgi:uncharacterized protein YbjT (DUF2867 family)